MKWERQLRPAYVKSRAGVYRNAGAPQIIIIGYPKKREARSVDREKCRIREEGLKSENDTEASRWFTLQDKI